VAAAIGAPTLEPPASHVLCSIICQYFQQACLAGFVLYALPVCLFGCPIIQPLQENKQEDAFG
jgi:hypothetical protein